MTFDDASLSSISGIIAVTFLIIEYLKRLFIANQGFGKIPVWVLTVVIAETLALFANHTKINGTVILPGDIHQIIWRAFLAAMSTSGGYTWVTGLTKSIGNANPIGTPTPIPTATQIVDLKDIVQK